MRHRWQLLVVVTTLAVLIPQWAPAAQGDHAAPVAASLLAASPWLQAAASADTYSETLVAQLGEQQPAEPGAAAEADQPVLPERMRPQSGGMILRPGDVLSISVQGEPQLTGQVHIRPDGLIVLPLLGTVQAAGLTVTELADNLTEDLKQYVRTPIVSVIQIGGVPRVVSVLGAVHAPGTYDVRQYERLLALLAAAGGPTPDADMSRAVLIRDGERALIVKEVVEGEPVIPEDIALQAGDAIVIPSMTERSVRVAGAVARTGLVMLEEGMTVSRAILAAGGPTPVADLTGVQLLRAAESSVLNVRPLLQPDRAAPGEEARDEILLIDDIIIVPEVRSQAVFVIGAVNAAGAQPAREAQTASKAVVMAGGASPMADLGRAYILRDGAQVELELRPLLAPREAPEDAEAVDSPVEPGDVVVVPEQRPIFVIGAVRTPGAVSPTQADSVSRAIVLAGGLAEDADKTEAYVLREGQQINVDLAALFDEADSSADVPLEPQDALIIPRRPQVFHVVGEVARPGTYALETAPTLLDAWALVGGPTLWANSSQAVLLRGEETETVNIERMVTGGDITENRELQAGDTILVPRIEDEVYVFGSVARPGAHPIHEGDTIIDVIADAGGPAGGADIGKVAIIRRKVLAEAREREIYRRPGERRRPRAAAAGASEEEREAAEKAEEIARKVAEGTEGIKLFDLAKVPEGDPRYLVEPGDVIYIPQKEIRRFDLMSILIQIATSMITGALL